MNRELEGTGLLRRMAAGDESALSEFYYAFEHTVYRYACLKLNDPHEANDILNEVMLDIWNSADRFEGRSKLSTWVLGITRHKVMDRLRKRRPNVTALDEEDEMEAPGVTDPAAHTSAAEQADLVRRCLAELSELQREVVYLTFYQGLSYPEIAAIADCPQGTVKTRMYHAKRALQLCLEKLTLEHHESAG